MVWKLGYLQSADNELRFDVETVLTVYKSSVFRLLIFKQHGWAIKPKRCYWIQWVQSPCTKLHKVEQKDRTKTLAEFPDHILNDYVAIFGVKFSTNKTPFLLENVRCLFGYFYPITLFVKTLYIYYLNISLSNHFFWSPKKI